MSIERATKDAELEQYLRQFGYCSLFSHRENLDEVMQYIKAVGDPHGQTPAVMTCVFLYVNTLLRMLHENEQLAGDHLESQSPSRIIQ